MLHKVCPWKQVGYEAKRTSFLFQERHICGHLIWQSSRYWGFILTRVQSVSVCISLAGHARGSAPSSKRGIRGIYSRLVETSTAIRVPMFKYCVASQISCAALFSEAIAIAFTATLATCTPRNFKLVAHEDCLIPNAWSLKTFSFQWRGRCRFVSFHASKIYCLGPVCSFHACWGHGMFLFGAHQHSTQFLVLLS